MRSIYPHKCHATLTWVSAPISGGRDRRGRWQRGVVPVLAVERVGWWCWLKSAIALRQVPADAWADAAFERREVNRLHSRFYAVLVPGVVAR